jgi:hypothetical protein
MMHPLANLEFVQNLPKRPDGVRVYTVNGVDVLFGLPMSEYHKPVDGKLWLSKTKLHSLLDPKKGPEWFHETYVKRLDDGEKDDGDRDVGESNESHFKVGRSIDTLVFDGEDVFKSTNRECPELYPSKAEPTAKNPDPATVMKSWHPLSNYCKAWYQEQIENGVTILTNSQLKWIYAAYNSIVRNDFARTILENPYWIPQVSFRWQDPGTGLFLQSRLDMVNFALGEWMDMKTTRYWSKPSYGREFVVRGYHLQGWLGEEAFRRIGIPPQGGTHLIVGKQQFPQVRVDHVSPQLIEAGEDTFQRATNALLRCQETGVWYERQDEESFIEVPQFVSDILARRQDVAEREIYEYEQDEIV